MTQTTQQHGTAKAKMTNLAISPKHSVEISYHLRYKSTDYAKQFLEDVIVKKRAVPMRRFNRDTGHKSGRISAGRFPQKAAKEFLRIVKSVEANAQNLGLATSALKITKLISNKAATPTTGGRHRYGTKRTHIEIEVQEMKPKNAKKKSATKAAKPVAKVAEKKEVPAKKEAVEVKAAKPEEKKQEAPVEKKEVSLEETKSESQSKETQQEAKTEEKPQEGEQQ